MYTIDLAYVGRGLHEELVAYIADQHDFYADEGVHVALRDGCSWDDERLRRSAAIGLGRALLSRLTDATPWVALNVNTHRPLFWFLARPGLTSLADLAVGDAAITAVAAELGVPATVTAAEFYHSVGARARSVLVSVPSATVRVSVNRTEQAMAGRVAEFEVLGPWSLETSRRFWEGFTPAALAGEPTGPGLRTVFCVEGDWRRAEAEVTQVGDTAHVVLAGDGDLDAAAAQARRFLALDVDGRGWPEVGRRDPVIADAQARLPRLRPCGFHSPYEAAAWSVLSQRLRIVQAARLRAELIARYGEDGAFPPPHTLARLDLDLPGRKSEYLRAVAGAALDGLLDGAALRALDPGQAIQRVQQVKGLGPFAAELVVVRGANAPDALPRHERRLDAEIAERYGPHRTLAEVSEAWRPYRTWAAVHLRALREQRTGEIAGR